MSETRRIMFVDSVSSATVQLRRVPGQDAQPNADAGLGIHQLTVVTGNNSSANATTGFWNPGGCHQYEVIIRRIE